ncbi:recombinase family protein [Labilibaculum antarcticum]|uniref:Resolvase/invertase-type recombinase catalytic domain-containing protein n=1 Tax=Labilibaculum antarcticum TaxID=1717717 RepID=A0A1Y1CIE5_9BACT|nr:recombinase family protein [Labilibaculum antarcticum]BAX79051.1 hypothetical protein ALGA_0662 [Labilibaculum antarcticum]
MKNKIYKYARVSTVEQNESRQTEGLSEGEGEMIVDKISGKIAFEKRTGGAKIIKEVKAGLVSDLIVYDIDRLGRDTINILQTLEFMKEYEVCVTVHQLGVKSITDGKISPAFDLITTVMAKLAQMEIERSKERQLEGIEAERKKDENRAFKDKAYKGRKAGSKNKGSKDLVEKYPDVKACLDSGMSIGKTVIATKICESTVKRIRKEYFKQFKN